MNSVDFRHLANLYGQRPRIRCQRGWSCTERSGAPWLEASQEDPRAGVLVAVLEGSPEQSRKEWLSMPDDLAEALASDDSGQSVLK